MRSFWARARGSGAAAHICLLLLAALIFIVVDPPDTTLFWDTVFDVGHTLLFAFVMWQALRIGGWISLPGTPIKPSVMVAAFTLTLMVAAASEVVQLFQPTRDANVDDFLRDAAGAVTVILFRLASGAAGRFRRWHQLALRGAAVAVIVLVTSQLVAAVLVYQKRDRAFPTIATFDGSYWENRLITTRSASFTPAHLFLQPGGTAGFTVHEPFPDWSGYQRVVIQLRSNVRTSRPLTVRIYDRNYRGGDENAFQRFVPLTAERQRIEISLRDIESGPQRRQLDLRQVRGISLFVWNLAEPVTIDLEPIRLE